MCEPIVILAHSADRLGDADMTLRCKAHGDLGCVRSVNHDMGGVMRSVFLELWRKHTAVPHEEPGQLPVHLL